jgi:hypothetical protein
MQRENVSFLPQSKVTADLQACSRYYLEFFEVSELLRALTLGRKLLYASKNAKSPANAGLPPVSDYLSGNSIGLIGT